MLSDHFCMAYDVGEMRAELGRLTQVMMAKSAQYLQREAELEAQYGHDPALLDVRLDRDHRLNKAGNAAKSCATLITALAAAITAEIAYVEHHHGSPGRANHGK